VEWLDEDVTPELDLSVSWTSAVEGKEEDQLAEGNAVGGAGIGRLGASIQRQHTSAHLNQVTALVERLRVLGYSLLLIGGNDPAHPCLLH
jgi:hypothetical protein